MNHRMSWDNLELFIDPDEQEELGKALGSTLPERRSYQGYAEDDTNCAPGDLDRRIAQTRDSGVDDLHAENLFDEDEDVYGNLIDSRSGENFDNSTFTDESYVLAAGGYIVDLFNADLEVEEQYDLIDAWLEREINQADIVIADDDVA